MSVMRFRIKKDGSVEHETQGFQGGACREASEVFHRLFGPPDTETPTAEMTEAPLEDTGHTEESEHGG